MSNNLFEFDSTDIGKFIVLKFRYEPSIWRPELTINYNKPDDIYGVYRIDWHSDYCKSNNDVSYKIHLTPIDFWEYWCPNRSWYTSDIESVINRNYKSFEEKFVFDNFEEANKYAIHKNVEMYPDTRSWFTKIKDFFKEMKL